MAKTTNRNATDWELKWCSITNRNKTKTDLKNLLISFNYYEDLDKLNPLAEIKFTDGFRAVRTIIYYNIFSK